MNSPCRVSDDTAVFVLAELTSEARRAGMPPDEVEEVVSDTMLWILRHRDRDRAVTRAWLRSVLRRFVTASWRARLGKSFRTIEDAAEDLVVAGSICDSELEVREILNRLTPCQRVVVRLRLQGLTWSEALDRVGVPPGSRSWWRARIRNALSGLRSRHLVWKTTET